MKNSVGMPGLDHCLCLDRGGGGRFAHDRPLYAQAMGRRTGSILVAKVESSIVHLATGRGAFKDMSDLHPALRMARCEHHYIFRLPRAGEPSLVVALFHERMDLMTRLQSRLA